MPVLAAVLTAAALLIPVPVASAQTSVTAAPSAEAWYRTLSLPAPPPDPCLLPTGCPPALPLPVPSGYAAGTLHAGVAGGAEESRTYLALDLSGVPVDAELTGGTLTLPVATDPQAGTVSPETAALRACLATGAVQDGVDGAVVGAPATDCATASDAVYRPAADGAPAAFTVDLAPFLEAWSTGTPSLALVPAQGQPQTATWHVAFSRRDRVAEGAAPISATLELTAAQDEATDDGGADVGDVTVDPGLSTDGSDVGFGEGASFAAPPLAAATAPLTAPVSPAVAAPTASVPVAAMLGGPFAYPAVFLLPLLVAGAVGWAGRAFTRDLAPVRG